MLLIDITDEHVRRFLQDRPECLEILTPRERSIVVARWSECDYQRKTYAELAKEQGGISRERIRMIEREAIKKIRHFIIDDPQKCQHCDGKGWV